MKRLRGFLIDLDGVLYVESQPIEGAIEAVNWLRSRDLPFRFLTNTTMRSQRALAEKLTNMGFPAKPQDIFSTCTVAAQWLKKQGIKRVHLMLPEEPQEDFAELEVTDRNPQAVVVGDLGAQFTFETLNKGFRLLKEGTRLIALQKNRFWQTLEGLSMDVGAFVAALEYAAEVEATVVGKPNPAYFQMALQDMALSPDRVAMVGDDIFTDIAGGNAAGLRTILVKTGKYQHDNLEASDIRPDHLLDSIAALPAEIEGGLLTSP